ncbi:ABC transporter permease [Candidatus Woesearchaeota archaeon]|nr:ABC transporter permease [Candidatus Woesearchaeota archaeon]
MLSDAFLFAVNGIKYRKLRSWLTILGIVIGISLIITMISLGEGMKIAVDEQLNKFGKEVIMIFPGEEANLLSGFIGGLSLDEKDIDVIKDIKGVDIVVPFFMKAVNMKYDDQEKIVLMHGIPPEEASKLLQYSEGWKIDQGRWLSDGKEVLLGSKLATQSYKNKNDDFKDINIKEKLTIEGSRFEVVGIVANQGERNHDFAAYMPIDELREITSDFDTVSVIEVKITPGEDPENTANEIKDAIKNRRKKEDFAVLTNEKAGEVAGNIIGIIEVVLLGIAGISLIVGGIGIMNTMYTSILERTKDIGVMKAIGAKNKTILSIFLIESGIIGAIGGIFGILFGWLLAKAVEFIAINQGFPMLKADLNLSIILLSISFGFIIGCVSGILPARKASKLKPVDALRYE